MLSPSSKTVLMQLLCVVACLACVPDDPEGSIFGGNLGDNYYCMPGPPSTTLAGTDTVDFCDEQLDNGTFDSVCDNSLYLRTPESVSGETFTTAKVIPGRNCRPNPDFTQVCPFSPFPVMFPNSYGHTGRSVYQSKRLCQSAGIGAVQLPCVRHTAGAHSQRRRRLCPVQKCLDYYEGWPLQFKPKNSMLV